MVLFRNGEKVHYGGMSENPGRVVKWSSEFAELRFRDLLRFYDIFLRGEGVYVRPETSMLEDGKPTVRIIPMDGSVIERIVLDEGARERWDISFRVPEIRLEGVAIIESTHALYELMLTSHKPAVSKT